MKKDFGSAEIIVRQGENSSSPFLNATLMDGYKDRMEYIIGIIGGQGEYKAENGETVAFQLMGIGFEDLQRMNPINLQEDYNIIPFQGKKIILSKAIAERYNIEAGSGININIGGNRHRFIVSGIANSTGPLLDDGFSVYAIVPRESMASIYNVRGSVSSIYMKPLDSYNKVDLVEELSDAHKRLSVKETYLDGDLQEFIMIMSSTFLLTSIIVLFMSVFIIYTSFKVIIMERLPVIGTFRSIGATNRIASLVMLLESIVYGLFGGVFGILLGIGILSLMAKILLPVGAQGFNATIQFTLSHVIGAFLLAVVISFASAFFPILKMSKMAIKDIIFNPLNGRGKKKYWKPILGLVLLALAFILPANAPRNLALISSFVSIMFPVLAAILLLPIIVEGFIRVFEAIYLYLFGNEGILAAKNLRDNKNVLNNISLLAIGISSLLVVNMVSYSVMTEVSDYYTTAGKFDVMVFAPRMDRNFEGALRRIKGVTDVYGFYRTGDVEVIGSDDRIWTFEGVDKEYNKYWDLGIEGDSQTILEELDLGRNILITNVLREKFQVELGDLVTLKFDRKEVPYKVIGFSDSLMANGNYAAISQRFFKLDTGFNYYSAIYVKTKEDPEIVADRMRKELARRNAYILTLEEMGKSNIDSNAQLFTILKGFSFLTMIIGIFGVMNNFIISFLERRRSFAVLRSIGMGKRQIVKMIVIESMTGGLIGGIVGVSTGILMLQVMPYLMKAMNAPIPMHFSVSLFINSMLAGIVISVVASVGPVLNSSKLNIIEAIKYE